MLVAPRIGKITFPKSESARYKINFFDKLLRLGLGVAATVAGYVSSGFPEVHHIQAALPPCYYYRHCFVPEHNVVLVSLPSQRL